MTNDADTTNFLRKALRANATFSAISGCHVPRCERARCRDPRRLRRHRRDPLRRPESARVLRLPLVRGLPRHPSRSPVVLAIIAADVAVGCCELAGDRNGGATSGGGTWAVATVADIVLLFAILQWLGLRKMEAGARTA